MLGCFSVFPMHEMPSVPSFECQTATPALKAVLHCVLWCVAPWPRLTSTCSMEPSSVGVLPLCAYTNSRPANRLDMLLSYKPEQHSAVLSIINFLS